MTIARVPLRYFLGVLGAGCALGQAAEARADDPTWVGIGGSFVLPLSSPTADLFGPGGAGELELSRGVHPFLSIGVRARYGVLSDGAAPSAPGVVDPGIGTYAVAELALRLRPFFFTTSATERTTGFVVDVGLGGAWTGDLLRPSWDVALGYGIPLGDATLVPLVRLSSIVHFDDQVDSRSAYLGSAGLELIFGDGRDHAVVAPEETEPEAPPVIGDLDGDGVLDPDDRCIDVPEDRDGFQDEDGCPDLDDDADGIPDLEDHCRTIPEDLDGLGDEDGCPEDDLDADGIADPVDQCPTEPEVVNGNADEDGCPDEGLVELRGDRVTLDDRVFFAFDRARVRHEAGPVLDALTRMFQGHPEWVRIRIEGHTDIRGSFGWNQSLSERRARNVLRALVARGLGEGRLVSVGFGESQVRVDGFGESVHRQNRRVEFVIETDPAAAPPPTTPTRRDEPATPHDSHGPDVLASASHRVIEGERR